MAIATLSLVADLKEPVRMILRRWLESRGIVVRMFLGCLTVSLPMLAEQQVSAQQIDRSRVPIRSAERFKSDTDNVLRQPSISDVLAWARTDVASNTSGTAPRIDGISDQQSSFPASSPSDSATLIPDDITPAELVAVLRLLQRQVNANTGLIDNNSVLVRQLRSQLNDVHSRLEQNLATQSEILQRQQQAIDAHRQVIDSVTREDAAGGRLLELSGNMSLSSEFANEVHKAIERNQPREGLLVIRNPLPTDQVVFVNDQRQTIMGGASLQMRVPLGNIVTRVPGGGTYNWFIGAPQYEVYIRLVEGGL